MPIEKRKRLRIRRVGPFLAEVTNHLDPTYMGSLEVVLKKGTISSIYDQNQTFIVRYLNPFYGVTSVRFEGNNPGDFNDSQKSYGMWMIPPDVGSTVMVIFVDADPNQGYWFGCIQDEFQNHMIPGIAASKNVLMTEAQRRKYGTSYLPVSEFLKKTQTLDIPDINKIPKPIHPFADRLLAQGLLLDTIRGVTSSGARRDLPSNVFGISTPGPLDTSDGSRKGKVGYGAGKPAPVSRLGGSSFVMDDGDDKGENELVRIRTRTGHQILLHNSQDLIYIANSKGTAWIELTSNGKIDIFAQDSVSIHTENDFNFRADRDINLEAGRDINIRASGSMQTNIERSYYLTVNDDAKITIRNKKDEVIGQDMKLSVGQSINMTSEYNTRITSKVSMDLSAARNMRQGAGGTFFVSAMGNYIESANEIHMNGPVAEVPNLAELAESPPPLPLYTLPNRKVEAGWVDGNFYKAPSISSIMQRVPTHEPWDQHENINVVRFSSTSTDVVIGPTKVVMPTSVPPVNNVPPSTVITPASTPSANEVLPSTAEAQSKSWSLDTSFIKKVKEVSAVLRCDYIDLLACMSFETGKTFDPSVRNKIGATGLIQFLPTTAKNVLGTTVDYLASLTRTKQMDWVLSYFKKNPLARVSKPSLEDLYMAILYPVAVGKPNSYVLFRTGTRAYQLNAGLDIGKKGYITKEDAATKVREHIPYVKQQLAKSGLA